MKLEKYHNRVKNIPDEVRNEVKFNMDVLERIHELLETKFCGKQKLLAEAMGKSEAEISKLLSGVQNYTTRTLMKFQAAFGEPIVAVCTNSDKATFVQVKVSDCISGKTLEVASSGDLLERELKYEDYKRVKVATP